MSMGMQWRKYIGMEKSNKKNQEELLEIYASHSVIAREGVEMEEITETREIH